MKFSMTKLAAATTLALACSGANAYTISGDTLLISILKDGQTGPSMLIDTQIDSGDLHSGALTSWASSTELTAAIDAFIGTSTDVEFYAVGYQVPGFLDQFALTTGTQLDADATLALDGNFTSFVTNSNSGVFATATDPWVAGIPDGDKSHYGVNLIYGNGFVNGTDMGTAATLNASEYFYGAGTNVTLLDWNLNDTGLLTYGEISAVPVPAAVWLFGSGLIGLVGVARRRKA